MTLTTSQVASIAGKIQGKKSRDAALKFYYSDPNKCLHCESIITVGERQKVADVRKKKFCGHSCSAIFNNPSISKAKCKCTSCGTSLRSTSKTLKCIACTCSESENLTKGALKLKRTSYQSSRSAIQKKARASYLKSGGTMKCLICGYSTHVEICHIDSVASFLPDAKISQINHHENLIALCRNHHWEFDNGILKLS